MTVRSRLKKAEPDQAFIKMGMYGSTGSGKTLTALLIAEWLCKQENEKDPSKNYRVAMVDTEHHGSTSYAMESKERKMPDGKTPLHPEAFDFDILKTRSVSEVLGLTQELREEPGEYKVFVLDSMSHIWEAAMAGWPKRTTAGTISKNDWGKVKKPVKDILENSLNGEFHFIFCGREGLQWEPDEKGEDKVVGFKMKAEGQTPYEPTTLIQMYQDRNASNPEHWNVAAYFEKDRTGAMMGKTIINPGGNVVEPLFKMLVGKHGQLETEEETAERDMKAVEEAEERKVAASVTTYNAIRDAVIKAANKDELKAAWELTKGKKRVLGPERFEALDALVDGRLAEMSSDNIVKTKAQKPAVEGEAN